MNTSAHAPPVVVGLDAIGALFGRGRQAIGRWIRTQGFPAARLPTGEWVTTPTLIDAWILERQRADPLLVSDEEAAMLLEALKSRGQE